MPRTSKTRNCTSFRPVLRRRRRRPHRSSYHRSRYRATITSLCEKKGGASLYRVEYDDGDTRLVRCDRCVSRDEDEVNKSEKKALKALIEKLHLDETSPRLKRTVTDTRNILKKRLDDLKNKDWTSMRDSIAELYTKYNKTTEGGDIVELLTILLLLTKSVHFESIELHKVDEIFWQGFSEYKEKNGICARCGISGGKSDDGIDIVVEMTNDDGNKTYTLIQVKFRSVRSNMIRTFSYITSHHRFS